jgi:pyruvate/2-oxoglutarate dehydrogenase complex dihydrolipoamide acyltransferase (E2) component
MKTETDREMNKRILKDCDKEQLLELLLNTLDNEKRLRNELDKLQGIIR